MKKQISIHLPTTSSVRGDPDATVVVDAATPQLRNRLLAYIEQFDVAEGLVLGMRGRTTQLVELRADIDEPIESMYRAWIGTQFVGTVLAKSEEAALKSIRKHLLASGYTKHSTRYAVVRSAVCKWPTNDFIKHLEAEPCP